MSRRVLSKDSAPTDHSLDLTHATLNFKENKGRAPELIKMIDQTRSDGADISLDTVGGLMTNCRIKLIRRSIPTCLAALPSHPCCLHGQAQVVHRKRSSVWKIQWRERRSNMR